MCLHHDFLPTRTGNYLEGSLLITAVGRCVSNRCLGVVLVSGKYLVFVLLAVRIVERRDTVSKTEFVVCFCPYLSVMQIMQEKPRYQPAQAGGRSRICMRRSVGWLMLNIWCILVPLKKGPSCKQVIFSSSAHVAPPPRQPMGS